MTMASVEVELLRSVRHQLRSVLEPADEVVQATDALSRAITEAERHAAAERDAANKNALYEIRRVIKGGIFMEGSEEAGRLRALRRIYDIAAGVLGQGEPVDNRGTCGCQNESPIDMIRGGEGTC